MIIQTNPKIIINVSNGCHALGWESATGKSYLFDTLLNAKRSGLLEQKVMCINALYDDIGSACDVLSKELFDIVVVDRFDVKPSDKLATKLWELRNKTIVLMDCKDFNKFYPGILNPVEVIYERGVLTVDE